MPVLDPRLIPIVIRAANNQNRSSVSVREIDGVVAPDTGNGRGCFEEGDKVIFERTL
jgi:hypothetical protein